MVPAYGSYFVFGEGMEGMEREKMQAQFRLPEENSRTLVRN